MEFDERELPLERFAEILAHVVHFGGARAEEVRERLCVAPDLWEAAEIYWIEALARDARSPSPAYALSFGQTFSAAKDRLREAHPPIEALGSLAKGGEPLEPPAERSEAPAPPRAGAESPALPPVRDSGAVSLILVPRSALASAGPSPWASGVTRDRVASAMPAPARVVARPPVVDPGASVDETAFVAAISIEPALPFGDTPSPEFLAAREHGATAGRHVEAAEDSGGAIDETAFITALHLDDPLPFLEAPGPEAASAPRAPAMPSGGDGLTLEQFASLRAELLSHPAERQMVLARYRVTNEGYPALANTWQARFAADPALEHRFEGLVREYLRWLARRQ